MEVSSGGKHDEPIQASPRKVGSLRKELVKGVAACLQDCFCLLDEHGSMDMGHEWRATQSVSYSWLSVVCSSLIILGYDKALTPVQVLPRKASSIVKPVCAMEIIVRWNFSWSRMRMTSGVGNSHGLSACSG